MFSRDPKHYRPTPRSVQQAFGPYHQLHEIRTCRRHERLCAVAGVIVLGVIYGILFAS
jgi:hypothetical protein